MGAAIVVFRYSSLSFRFPEATPSENSRAGSEQNQSSRRQIESYISSVGFHITQSAQSRLRPSPRRLQSAPQRIN